MGGEQEEAVPAVEEEARGSTPAASARVSS